MSNYIYNEQNDNSISYQISYENGSCSQLLVTGAIFISMLVNTSFYMTQATNIFSLEKDEALYQNNPLALKYNPHAVKQIELHSEYESAERMLNTIESLKHGWDGYSAVVPDFNVVNNARKFIDCLSRYRYTAPTAIEPTPYGSVVMDFEDNRGLVSVEIGRSKIGWFTDFMDGHNYASDGIECRFNFIPQALEQILA